MKNNTNEQLEKRFWRDCSKPVPGRPTLKTNSKSKPCQILKPSSFEEFQESVDDAWDLKDDEFYKKSGQRNIRADISAVHSIGCGSKNTLTANEFDFGKVKIESDQSSAGKLIQSELLLQSGNKFGSDTRNNSKSSFSKVLKLQSLLESSLLNLDELRLLSWSGVPHEIRSDVWKLLAGYLPASLERRERTLERKRLEYWNLVKQYFDSKRDEAQEKTYRQIHIDIPRMTPMSEIFQQKSVQIMFERILYTWAVRHPATGYVQGMNDLVTPFFFVFLQEFLPKDCDPDLAIIDNLFPKECLSNIEADSFWCFSKFLDGIQDNFIFAQLGIQSKVNQLKELIRRIDKDFHKHLESNEIDYLQFSFRWMNNLLTREIPLRCSFRLWDTYLAELDNFSNFQLYVSAAFLLQWRDKLLQEKDFQGLIIFLHNPPTQKWTDVDVGMLLADAHRLMFMFADSPNHLQNIQS